MEENILKTGGFKSPKFWLMIIGMVLIAGIVVVALIREKIISSNMYQVSVIGQSKITYQPDTAKVTLGVQVDKVYRADEALKQLNNKVQAVYKSIEDLGIAKEDIDTENYSLQPQYDFIENVSRLAGYNANQLLTVKIKNILENKDMVSKVVAAATTAGANQINSIVFETSKLNELKDQARMEAINDARNKAGGLANALGVKLGKVVGWWENLISPAPVYDYSAYGKGGSEGGMGGGTAGSPVVPSGSQELVMEVTVNYLVK